MNSSKRNRRVEDSKGCGLVHFLFLCLLLLSLANGAYAEPPKPVSVVEVLVLYTPQAAAGAGGAAPMLKQINVAMAEANTVLQNSQVNARLHLALASRIDYVESGSVSNDLAQLRKPGNGVLGQAHRLRDQYNADLVCLVTETGSGWWLDGLQGPSADNAFSVIRRPYLTGGYYLATALGINFGCQMEHWYADSVGAFPYAYGYSFWGDTLYSTVENPSLQRIPFFSNPEILWQGVPIGVAAGEVNAANNALVINQTAPLVAAFRGTAPVTFAPTVRITAPRSGARFRAGTNVSLSATATDPDGKVVRVDFYEGTNWLSSSGTAPFKALWSKVSVGAHTVFAVSTDNAGAATVSEPVHVAVFAANDDFASRTRLSGTNCLVRASNISATAELGEPDHSGYSAVRSLWWTYTAPVDGRISISATVSTYSVVLSVYEGTALNALTEVVSTDGMEECAVDFQVARGHVYQIAIDSVGDSEGDVELDLSFAPTPLNDNFAHRQRLSGTNVVLHADNWAASREIGEPDHSYVPGCASIWWSWTAPKAGKLILTPTSAAGGSLLVGVYTGTALANLVPVSVQFEDPLTLTVEKGCSYQIAVDSRADEYGTGPFELDLEFVPGPPNNRFADRTRISGTSIDWTNSTAFATVEPGAPVSIDWEPAFWWSWTAPASGYVTIDCPSAQYIDVFTGSTLANLSAVTVGTPVSFESVAGTTYAIAASEWFDETVEMHLSLSTLRVVIPTNGASFFQGDNIAVSALSTKYDGILRQVEFFANELLIGTVFQAPYRIVWTNAPPGGYALTAVGTDASGKVRSSSPVSITVQIPPPSNDNFANRTVLQGTWLVVTNSNFTSTLEPGEPRHAGNPWHNSIWWSWTAPVSGRVTLSTPSFLADLGVYTGASLSNLTAVASGSSLTFEASAGTCYQIAAVGYAGEVVLRLALSNLRLVSPVDGLEFVAEDNIPLLAEVTATEEPVRKVEFFHNGISLGCVSNSPYGLIWSNASGGTHRLTVISTDDQGHARTAPPITIGGKPVNDNFSNATALFGSVVHTNGSTAGATSKPGEPQRAGLIGCASVWYSWTAPDLGHYTVALDSSRHFLAIYTGVDLSHLTLVTSNASWPRAAFSAEAGTNYFIAVGTNSDSGGAFTLDILKSPANDNFADRIQITNANTTVVGNNSGASWEPGESVYTYNGGQSIWWTWTAPQSGQVVFSPQSTSTPILRIYAGSVSTNLQLLLQRYWGPSYDQIYDVTAGTSYAICADGKWNDDGSIAFSLDFTPSPPRPVNDDFTNSIALTGTNITVTGDNRSATVDSGGYIPIYFGNHTVWYTWTAPTRGLATVSAASTNFAPNVTVYTGTDITQLQQISTNSATGQSFVATAGGIYHIKVSGDGGFFTLNLSVVAAPQNDVFGSRIMLSGMNPTVDGTVFLARFQSGQPDFYPWVVDRCVWYSWIAPADGAVRVHCPGRPIAVYSGNSILRLAVVAPAACEDLFFSATKGMEYEIAVAGASWLPEDFTLSIAIPNVQIVSPTKGSVFEPPATIDIVAHTIESEGGVSSVSFYDGTNLLGTLTNAPFRMEYRDVPVGVHILSLQSLDENGMVTVSGPIEVRVKPANDDFEKRIPLIGASAIFSGDNSGATSEPGEILPAGASGRTLWWTWTAPSDGRLTISNSASLETVMQASNIQSESPVSVTVADPVDPFGSTNWLFLTAYTGSNMANLKLCASNSVWYHKGYKSNPAGGVTEIGQWCVVPSFSMPVVRGQAYQFSIDGVNGRFGSGTVTLSFVPPPANDSYAQSTVLSGSSIRVTGTTVAATREPGEPSHGGGAARTVWYSWTAPARGNVEVTAAGLGDFDIAVYAGSSLQNLIPVSIRDHALSFYANGGSTYKIAVSGLDRVQSDFTLIIAAPPAPPTIHTARFANGSYQVRVEGVAGQSFALQASSDSQHWVTIRTDTLVDSTLEFVDSTAQGLLQRFYRVLPLDTAFNSKSFTLHGPSYQSGHAVSLRLSGMAGQPFRMQVSSNLVDWVDFTGGILRNEPFDVSDPDAAEFNSRFYRAFRQ